MSGAVSLIRECQNCRNNIKLLLRFIKEKSTGLFVHSVYTAKVASTLANSVGLPPEEVGEIYIAGLLHDIGKLFLANSILLGEGRLTEEQFELIKPHPQKGAEILSSTGLYDTIPVIVLHHHELPDGSGYPAGLGNADIPVAAKIICIADKYAALTQQRTYRSAYSSQDAVVLIRDHIKGFFDGVSGAVEASLHSSGIHDLFPFVYEIMRMRNYDLLFDNIACDIRSGGTI